MEALLYRYLVRDLHPMLLGRRLERIYAPRPGWWTFRLQPADHPRYLLFAHHPADVALTLSSGCPENPQNPTGQAMLLRKKIQGRRILEIRSDWVSRRMALGMGLREPESWLILDSRKGVCLEPAAPDWDPAAPTWPSWDQIRTDSQIWQSHPQVSPLLRQTLQALPPEAGRSLLADLCADQQPECFFVYHGPPGQSIACPWALPEAVRKGRTRSDFPSAFLAAGRIAREIFFPDQSVRSDPAPPQAAKRRKRLLANLQADEQRLREYVRQAEKAQLIRQNLYRLSGPITGRSRTTRIQLPDHAGNQVELELDGRKTVLENMERWFQLADKGRRGLAHVQRRREILAAEGPQQAQAPVKPAPSSAARDAPSGKRRRPARRDESLPLHRFLSSDGFVLLRGKNQKANHALLTKAASSFDLWFHAADGPGSHLILKRDSPEQDIPEQTLIEAAGLAGLASHFAGSDRATIICAQVKYVRTVKGAPGMAKVDRVHRTFHVALDPKLEHKLKTAEH